MFVLYKVIRRVYLLILSFVDRIICWIILKGNNVNYSTYTTLGIPYVMVSHGGYFFMGSGVKMNNGIKSNPIGCYSRCTFFVGKGAKLIIGNNVGISQSALVCHIKIIIGNNVKIGGGVKIFDTDFHSLNPLIRNSIDDINNKEMLPVIIKDNVFIGAFSIILKGVTIGENSIVGAGSVVVKSVPDNQIWAGNPAKFIRNI